MASRSVKSNRSGCVVAFQFSCMPAGLGWAGTYSDTGGGNLSSISQVASLGQLDNILIYLFT